MRYQDLCPFVGVSLGLYHQESFQCPFLQLEYHLKLNLMGLMEEENMKKEQELPSFVPIEGLKDGERKKVKEH